MCMCAVLAYFVAAMSPNMDVANAALPVYVSTLLFFGGFLFTFDAMPPWWKWYSYINPLRCVVSRNVAWTVDTAACFVLCCLSVGATQYLLWCALSRVIPACRQ